MRESDVANVATRNKFVKHVGFRVVYAQWTANKFYDFAPRFVSREAGARLVQYFVSHFLIFILIHPRTSLSIAQQLSHSCVQWTHLSIQVHHTAHNNRQPSIGNNSYGFGGNQKNKQEKRTIHSTRSYRRYQTAVTLAPVSRSNANKYTTCIDADASLQFFVNLFRFEINNSGRRRAALRVDSRRRGRGRTRTRNHKCVVRTCANYLNHHPFCQHRKYGTRCRNRAETCLLKCARNFYYICELSGCALCVCGLCQLLLHFYVCLHSGWRCASTLTRGRCVGQWN